ncbi:hypothetical protein OTU49_015988 [Cherax quadricarinatus]|uniref:Uncharacterized protein n=1 Tax=Cherax quadricarinatus TaxID=27406 RepID=A0AAW0YAW5_CHEQU
MNSKRNSLIRSKKGTKRKQNNVQQKKMKKVSKRKGFTIDTRSSSVVSMSGKQSQKNISVTNKRHALGYDSLEEREEVWPLIYLERMQNYQGVFHKKYPVKMFLQPLALREKL